MKTKGYRKQRLSPRAKQKHSLRWVVGAGIALAMIVGGLLFFYLNIGNSGTSYAAGDDNRSIRSGYWIDGSTWNTGTSPGTNVPKGQDIQIRRYVTSEESLNFAKDATLTITDTLVILGDLTIDKDASLVIEENGALLVVGNLTADKNLSIGNGGVIAVGGTASFAKDLAYDNSSGGELFVLGDVNESKKSNELGSAQNGPALQNQYPEFYDIVTGNNTTLPIVLSYFTARAQGQHVLIEWATEGEIDNDYFTVERSSNAQQPEVVGTVAGAGTSQDVRTYTFTDKQPLPGTSYYRLRQTDYDGQDETFAWTAVSLPTAETSLMESSVDAVFPNPFTSFYTITFTLSASGPVKMEMVDLSGNVVVTQVIEGSAGQNQYQWKNLQALKSGTYLLRLVHNSRALPIKRVIKQ